MVESLLSLPEELLRPFLTEHLIPGAGREVLALNLLGQMTEDELRFLAARLVPQESLLTLSSELLEFPWEEVQRQRLVEAITSAVRDDDDPPRLLGDAPLVLDADDPLVVELREEILAACQPEVLIERSADILLALVLNVDGEDQGASAVDALEEIVGEALVRGRIDLATHVLSTMVASVESGGARSREHAQHLAVLQQRLAGRAHVTQVGAVLRQHASSGRLLDLGAQYLGLVAREAIQEFTALLAEEPDRQVRARMCQVLAKVGPPAVPVLLELLEDPRWFLVRNLVHVLGKIGDEAAFGPAVSLLDHAHPRVRIEAIRAVAVIAPRRAVAPLVGLVADADPEVRARGRPGARRAAERRGRSGPARCGERGLATSHGPRAAAGGDRGAGGDRDAGRPRGADGAGPAALALETGRAPAARGRRQRARHATGFRGGRG